MSLRWTEGRKLRILDFDTECRPMHYSEWRSEDQITAIAWSWVGRNGVSCEVLEQDLSNERPMLEQFLSAYASADVVTGHYITKHDLPLLNDHCVRNGWSALTPKLAQDTKTLFPKVKGLGLSQENLATLRELDTKKHHMNGRQWAVANNLSPGGRESARQRVVSDVKQHKKLRVTYLQYLKAPRVWQP